MAKGTGSARLRDDTARVVAKIHGVSVRYVQMVRNGERENEAILATLVDYQVEKTALIKALEKLIPLQPNPEKYGKR